ncbi:LPS export ABC transporter permease LptF [Pleionea sp. CnH1-48]|uniref:LPS export ABC transporter permease LptF n=1 Tax=Pleionea sp. CnH1-48 TaxID=2954494 RepID=UPI002097F51B|nr:LPS export ABC transporter permease LptF [Pleionea sp. CnH1-48]
MRLRRYLNKAVLSSTLSITFILMLIFLSQRFVRFLGDAVEGKIASDVLLSLVGLQVPALIGFLLPLAFFLGILLAFGRLYVDNELVVTRSLGVGDKMLARFIAPSIIGLALVASVLTLFLTPWSIQTQQQLLSLQDSGSELRLLGAGRFQETADKKGIMYVAENGEDGEFKQVFFARLADEEKELPWALVSAEQGNYWQDEKTGQHFLVLNNGVSYQIPGQGGEWTLTEFARYFMNIPEQDKSQRRLKVKAVATTTLLQELSDEHWAEIHWRLSVPISIPLLALLAVPLSRVQPRQGKFARMLPAIIIYMSYAVLMLATRGAIEDGKVPGVLGFWWIHGLLAVFTLWQYRSQHKKIKRKKVVSVKGEANE